MPYRIHFCFTTDELTVLTSADMAVDDGALFKLRTDAYRHKGARTRTHSLTHSTLK